MHVDPLDSLALSLNVPHGAYAVLLGSGVSQAAGIPTGWDIIRDLTRKLAHLRGASAAELADPIAWYQAQQGEAPRYATLLAALAKTPNERNQLLRAYFEPTEEERSRGLKVPTVAHTAIATLVRLGRVRVIITTNFDRLMEQALEAAGIQPVVLGTADAVRGAEPLERVVCTVLKVHGDYLDVRFRNTPEELADYADEVNTLLDRTFDEYGLVVCGWSATWDTALRAALQRAPGRRYTTYWSTRGALSEAAQQLVTLRRAEVVAGKDANALWSELLEKVRDLANLERPPLTKDMLVARLKRYVEEGTSARIRLHDLLVEETERVYTGLTGPAFASQGPQTTTEYGLRLEQYTALCETLLELLISGCRWGTTQQARLWVQSLERCAPIPYDRGWPELLTLRSYPLIVLLYGSCLAAWSGDQYDTLATLLTAVRVPATQRKVMPVYRLFDAENMLQASTAKIRMPERGYVEVSGVDYLYHVLREPLRVYVPDDARYTILFHRFEYLYSLLHVDARLEANEPFAAPVGHFFSARSFTREDFPVLTDEMTRLGAQWPPLKAGLFGGSLSRLTRAKAAVDDYLPSGL